MTARLRKIASGIRGKRREQLAQLPFRPRFVEVGSELRHAREHQPQLVALIDERRESLRPRPCRRARGEQVDWLGCCSICSRQHLRQRRRHGADPSRPALRDRRGFRLDRHPGDSRVLDARACIAPQFLQPVGRG